jgi:polysaccharide biosynthesis transport protein
LAPKNGIETAAAAKARTASSPGRDLLEYIEVPLRRPLHLIVPLVVLVTVAVVASFVLPKKYLSSTLIMVESEKVPDSFVRRMNTQTARQRVYTLKQELLSRTRLEKVLREVDPYPDRMGKEPLSNIVEGMRRNININIKGTDAFSIEYTHTDPRLAMAVANRLGTLFIEDVAQEREEQVEGAYEFIESQLDDSRRELEVKEEALRKFKERHMGTLPTQTEANLSTLQRLQMEQQGIGDQLRGARDRLAALEKGSFEPTAVVSAPGARPSNDPNTELMQLRSQLVSLRGRYTDEHPDVKVLMARIARLEATMAEAAAAARTAEAKGETAPAPADPAAAAARAQLENARREVRALEGKRDSLDQRINDFQARVEVAPRTEQEMFTLTRDYNKLHENYSALLNKKLEAQMAEKLEKRWKGENFRIIDPARLPESPVFPNRLLFLVGGLGLGLFVGLAASIGAELLDHSIKNIRDLETVLPYPVLATVPHIPQPRSGVRAAGLAEAAREI